MKNNNHNDTEDALLKNGRVEGAENQEMMLTDLPGEADPATRSIHDTLRIISDKLNIMREFVSGKEQDTLEAEVAQAEWAVAASIIDRLFLVVFCLASAIILAKVVV